MEPNSQVEIQLGHMCNNRCVFCVSGQETQLGRARPLEVEPIIAMVREARAMGHSKITLLGGEPTLQPGFLDVVREAAQLGFTEVVVFTNGVKTARAAFVDEVLATGAPITWRISLQGATKQAHERTTQKPGSFDRIEQTLAHLSARRQRVTVNMCVVRSNYESVSHFARLILPHGATQLHLDMMRPLDAGQRTDDELRETIPRYSDMVPHLEAMVAGFDEGFDVNIGNLPHCIAPRLAHVIHHDGTHTLTVSVDSSTTLSRPWDKYLTKKRDKIKPPSCRECVFDGRCSGVYDTYARFYGTDELRPVTAEQLAEADPKRRLLSVHLLAHIRKLGAFAPPPPFTRLVAREQSEREVSLTLEGPEPLSFVLGPPGRGLASTDLFSLSLSSRPLARDAASRATLALFDALSPGAGRVHFPPPSDLFAPLRPSIGARLARLRQEAPFGELTWQSLSIAPDGGRAEATLVGAGGERAVVYLSEDKGKPAGGYRLEGEPTPALVEGLRRAVAALGVTAPRRAPESGVDAPR